MQHAHISAKGFRLGALLLLTQLFSKGYASYLTGSQFPFEMCKLRNQDQTRFWADLYRYRVSTRAGGAGSQVCFKFELKERSLCSAPKTRCCSTIFNKFKMYIDGRCKGSIHDITINGRKTSSLQYEYPLWNKKKYTIAKITNIDMPNWEVDKTVLCFYLRGKCKTLEQLTPPENRVQGAFEFAMYDKKVDGYECCPMFIVPTDDWGGVRGEPFFPNYPQMPPKPPSPPKSNPNGNKKKSPPPPRRTPASASKKSTNAIATAA